MATVGVIARCTDCRRIVAGGYFHLPREAKVLVERETEWRLRCLAVSDTNDQSITLRKHAKDCPRFCRVKA